MDSKSLSTILIVIVCVLLFPLIIGIIGGVFGVVAGIIGAVFGAIGGAIGAVFGVIGAIFGAIFGIFGWIFGGGDDYWHGPFHFFDKDLFAAIALVIVAVLIVRSRNPQRPAK